VLVEEPRRDKVAAEPVRDWTVGHIVIEENWQHRLGRLHRGH
jgi:hypothetical protein